MLDALLVRGASPAVTSGRDSVLRFAWVTMDSAQRGHLFVMTDGKPAQELVDPLGPAQFDGETPPKLDVAPNGALVMSYAVSVPDSTAKYKAREGLRFVRSDDGGATWGTPVSIADNGDLGTYRNDHTMNVARDGTIYVAWLDERTADTIRVYMARSDDGGHTWTRNTVVDMDEACGCCRTPITTGPDGTVYTIWRKKLPGGIRDFVVARSTDRGKTWSKSSLVHADNFEINACPDAGPSLAVDDDNRLHIAWWTGREGAAGVRHAYSDDGGAHFSTPTQLGVSHFSKGAHAQLLLRGKNGVAVTWDDGTTNPVRIALRESSDRGATFDSLRYLSASGATASFPVIAGTRNGLAVVWQERGAVKTPREATPASLTSTSWRAYDGAVPTRLVRMEISPR